MPLITKLAPETSETKRVLIVGPPGWGKSTAAGTFPEPLWVNTDNNVPEEYRKRGDDTFNLYDLDWIKSVKPKIDMNNSPLVNQMIGLFDIPRQAKFGALCYFLLTDARKLTPNRTLIFDNTSFLADFVMEYTEDHDEAEIKKNPHARYGNFGEYMLAIFTSLQAVKCNYVVISHENEIRDDDTNRLLGRRWLMPGKFFTPRLPSFFNNIFRQTKVSTVINRTTNAMATDVNVNEKVKDEYYWQIRKDELFDTIRTTIPGDDKFVKSHYNSFTTKK